MHRWGHNELVTQCRAGHLPNHGYLSWYVLTKGPRFEPWRVSVMQMWTCELWKYHPIAFNKIYNYKNSYYKSLHSGYAGEEKWLCGRYRAGVIGWWKRRGPLSFIDHDQHQHPLHHMFTKQRSRFRGELWHVYKQIRIIFCSRHYSALWFYTQMHGRVGWRVGRLWLWKGLWTLVQLKITHSGASLLVPVIYTTVCFYLCCLLCVRFSFSCASLYTAGFLTFIQNR